MSTNEVLPKKKGEIAKENGESGYKRNAKPKEVKEKKPKAPKKKRARKPDSSYQSHDERASNVKNDSFIRLEGWMANKLMATGIDLIVFALIHSFTETTGNFYGTQTHIADWLNITTNTVRASIKRLVDLKYIETRPHPIPSNKNLVYRSRILWDVDKELVEITPKIWDDENNFFGDAPQIACDNKKDIPKDLKALEKKVVKKDNEGVSPNTEDTPSGEAPSASEMEELKKQMAEVQKMLANSIEMNKQKEKEERERERREIEAKFEEEKRRLKEEKIAEQKRYEQEVEERFQQRLKEQTEKQGQNLVEKTDKTKPSLKEEKDDKVKGVKEEGQEPTDVTDTFDYNVEGVNAVFGGFEYTPVKEDTEEEENITDVANDWFFN